MRTPLIILGLFALTRFIAYAGPLSPAQTPSQLEFIDETVPLWIYAIAWGVAGVVIIASARLERLRPTAIGLNVAMHSVWGILYMVSYLFYDSPRAWIASSTYLCIAAMVTWVGTRTRRLGE